MNSLLALLLIPVLLLTSVLKASAALRVLPEHFGTPPQQLRIEYPDNDLWKTAHEGTSDGPGVTGIFPEVKAEKFRLVFLNPEKPPTASECRLFRPE